MVRCCDKFNWKDAFKLALAEFLATVTLIAVGCTGAIMAGPFGGLCFGCSVILIILMFGHISGAHANPSVTIACLIMGTLKWKISIFYVLAQFFGAVVGYMIPYFFAIRHDPALPKCTTTVHPNILPWQALILEFIATAGLVFIVCSSMDVRITTVTDNLSLKIGFGLTSLFIAFGPLTASSINTARSFAPAVYNNVWTDHWIYWVGPNLGAVFTAMLCRFVFKLSATEEEKILMEAEKL